MHLISVNFFLLQLHLTAVVFSAFSFKLHTKSNFALRITFVINLLACLNCASLIIQVNIQVHFAVKHSNECKVYKCSRCASVFRSEMECQLHVKVHHLGVSKPYRCFFCKDSFGIESDLQAHVASHKKQFVCPICHEAFLVEYLLDKHLETKHSSPDVQLTSSRPEISVVTTMLAPPSLPPDGILFAMQTTSPSSIVSDKRTPVSPSAFVGSASSPSAKKGDLIYKCEVSNACLHLQQA